MTRMIERWFPCKEVSENSGAGWGSGNAEQNLFPWFAQRPTAQAKAAVICSLLPWPDDEANQVRLQKLVREAMTGRYAAWRELREELVTDRVPSVLDPFSGRGMIPLEAARLGLAAECIDYAPVAVTASTLLTEFPFRDWRGEPQLPFEGHGVEELLGHDRLLGDVRLVFAEVQRRITDKLSEYFPSSDGRQPWGYLWAVALPCQECGRIFPLIGSYQLRLAKSVKGTKKRLGFEDSGQSFYIDGRSDGTFSAVVHDGPPRHLPTLTAAVGPDGKKIAGKAAICPFCSHVHPTATHRRLTNEGLGQDVLLVVADLDSRLGKVYREPQKPELEAIAKAKEALSRQPRFSPTLPAVPDERIPPGNNNIIGPSIYGARTYGDLMCDRQTLNFVVTCQVINEIAGDLRHAGLSEDYTRALAGYAASVVARKLRRSTRGCTLQPKRDGVSDVYSNQGSLVFSYDFFEAGIGLGPGTWDSISSSTASTVANLLAHVKGAPASIQRGSATELPYRTASFDAVVTDPPYDQMLAYSDSSDVLFCWVRRALSNTWPELGVTADPHGTQEKALEIIVKRVRGEAPDEHRSQDHYDSMMVKAFQEMRRVVRDDGVVTIVFGHGEPEVWHRLLTGIERGGLVMTGSWPANTEDANHQEKANIETTLTMVCRPATADRPSGRKARVEAEIRAEVRERMGLWERAGLAPTDMLMASAGPAMEVAGRYVEVLDARGEPVEISTFLPLARAAVQEAMAVEIDHHPLETFDARTRFALWWVRLYSRQPTAKSELRWQALAASLELAEVRNLLRDVSDGCQFVQARDLELEVGPQSSVIDVALAMARAFGDGLQAVGETLTRSGRDVDDGYLWAAISFLADHLPAGDSDVISWNGILRNRAGVGTAARTAVADIARSAEADMQLRLL